MVSSTMGDVKGGTKKVTMNLTERDIQNTTELQRIIHARSKAGAVSYSLSLATMLASQIEQGAEIYIKDKSGETHKLLFTGV